MIWQVFQNGGGELRVIFKAALNKIYIYVKNFRNQLLKKKYTPVEYRNMITSIW